MKFNDLLLLPFHGDSNRIIRESALSSLLGCPAEVLDQLYLDHGRNPEFQARYSELNIDRLNWRKVSVTGSELLKASCIPQFRRHIESVRKRAENFQRGGWEVLSTNVLALNHWKKHGTWMLPPVFVQGEVVGESADLHLMEGHTRLGMLGALIDICHIHPSRNHEIWLAK